VVASHLHTEDVVSFLRDAEPLLAQPKPSIQPIMAGSVGSMPTTPEADNTKRDLALRLRMSPLGRLLFGPVEK
jgi:hypothetical protein